MPNEKRVFGVFKNEKNLNAALAPMLKAREEVYSDYSSKEGSELLKLYKKNSGQTQFIWDGKPIKTETQKLHSMRSVLLQNRFPDEQKTLYAISRIKPAQFKFDPGIYQYGGIYFYSCGAFIKLCSVVGLCELKSDTGFYMKDPRQTALLYAAGKFAGAFAAALFCVILLKLGTEFFSFRAGLFSAFFAASLPSLAFESHSLKPYSFFLPFWAACLYFALKAFKEREKFAFFYFLSGLFSGLCGGAMLLGSFCSFSFLAAYFFYARENSFSLKLFFLAPLGFLLGFFAGNPYYLLSFKAALAELAYVKGMHSFHFSLSNMLHFSFLELPKIASWPVLALAFFSVYFAFKQINKFLAIVFAPFAVYFVYTSNAHWDFPHYSMPLLPALLISSGFAVEKLSSYFPKTSAFFIFCILFNAGNLLHDKKIFLENEENLNEAGLWISENIPAGSKISFDSYPYFGFKSYPPFPVADYKIVKEKEGDYYILNEIDKVYHSMNISYGDSAAKTIGSSKEYVLLKEFSRKKTFLDKIYPNHRYSLFEQRIAIYKKVRA